MVWSKSLVDAFYNAKEALQQISSLYPFDPCLRTFIMVDSSKDATGAVCYQKRDGGTARIVGFFSRKRRCAERKIPLSSCYLELAGLVAVTAFWRCFILDAKTPVTVLTDSASVAK